jgi:hypothetical protein
MDNRRQALVDFANANKFDPYVASNWYTVTANQLRENKVEDALRLNI